ncbi:Acg family FMN-binding oxidoreductase [Mycolicibacterium sphagni]|uniref:NAD(P)H nitroreductase n=1 Tax=Mycolicibacterium sphagni TaxID=1786 RepID=A0A255D5B2_9MYCO|nr:nitroreductase family protein [Mycolicibacterium sphagni]OYN74489.1 NAD(P)H nitroreductase [Mycolicibacterium sphagni]
MTRTTVETEIIAKAIHLACRAPSLHNSQPWRWVLGHAAVDLFADHERVVRSADRSGREAIISCGAALDHLRMAMAAAGWRTNVDPFPNPSERDHLASVDFTPAHYVTSAERDRADAILSRRTDRLPLQAPSQWESFEPVLRRTLDHSKATLDVVADDARPSLAEASRLTESIRRYDENYRDELHWWTRRFSLYQGVPPSALVSERERARVGIGREFPTTQHGRRRSDIAADHAKVLVLSTHEDTRADALNCGEALSTVLVECTTAGLATCTLTHITEIAEGRAVIQNLTGSSAFPQVLIRVGTAPALDEAPSLTPRRPMSEVLQIRR